MRLTRNSKLETRNSASGQSSVEYAVLAAVLVAACLAMQVYAKRGISGKLRASADSIGEQYAPTETTGAFTTTTLSDSTTTTELVKDRDLGGGKTGDVMITTMVINNEETSKAGQETVATLGTDLWK